MFEVKAESDRNFEALTRRLLDARGRSVRVAIASHNLRSVAHAVAANRALGGADGDVELQVLRGLGDDLAARARRARPARAHVLPGRRPRRRHGLPRAPAAGEHANESFLAEQASGAAARGAAGRAVTPARRRSATSRSSSCAAPPRASARRRRWPRSTPQLPLRVPLLDRRRPPRGRRARLDRPRRPRPGRRARRRGDRGRRRRRGRGRRARRSGVGAHARRRARAAMLLRAAALAARAPRRARRARGPRVREAVGRGRRRRLRGDRLPRVLRARGDRARARARSSFQVPGERNAMRYAAARRRRRHRAVELPARDPDAGWSPPALATGNTVVLKPAEQSPGCALRGRRGAARGRRPAGAIAPRCPGEGESAPRWCATAACATIAFTGSRRRSASRSCATAAEVAARPAAPQARRGRDGRQELRHRRRRRRPRRRRPGDRQLAFGYAGPEVLGRRRACSCHEAIADALLERLAGAVDVLLVGQADDFGTDVPPVIEREARERVERYRRDRARRAGAIAAARARPSRRAAGSCAADRRRRPARRLAACCTRRSSARCSRSSASRRRRRVRPRRRAALRAHRRPVRAQPAHRRARHRAHAGRQPLRQPRDHRRDGRPPAVRRQPAVGHRDEGRRPGLPPALRRAARGHREHGPPRPRDLSPPAPGERAPARATFVQADAVALRSLPCAAHAQPCDHRDPRRRSGDVESASRGARVPPARAAAPARRLAYNYRWSWTPGGPELFASDRPGPLGAPARRTPCGCSRRPAAGRSTRVAARRRACSRALARGRGDASRPTSRARRRERRHAATRPIAYFCAEYGVHRSLPVYSGGLGALAGDILKEASDRALPLVAVGLMYRHGYFRQRIDAGGWQHEYWVDTDPERLPAALVTGDDGEPLTVTVPVGDREVVAQIWRVDVGRVPLLLLDADRPENAVADRWITSRLYIGDADARLAQYAAARHRRRARAGGDGHRARRSCTSTRATPRSSRSSWRARRARRRRSTDEALAAARARTIFTTHTPVPAGNDTYPADAGRRAPRRRRRGARRRRRELIRLGRTNPDDARRAVRRHAVRAAHAARRQRRRRRHGEVAREMWHGPVARPRRRGRPDRPRHQRRAHPDVARRPDARAARPPPRRGLAATAPPTRRPGTASTTSPTRTCGPSAREQRRELIEYVRAAQRHRPPRRAATRREYVARGRERVRPGRADDRLRPPPGDLQAAGPAAAGRRPRARAARRRRPARAAPARRQGAPARRRRQARSSQRLFA